MAIHEERVCKGLKENTKLELDIYPHKTREGVAADVLLHVTHGPAFWNDQGRKITFFLNGTVISEQITDKDGRCRITIPNIPSESAKAVLLVHAEETALTTPCEISVDIWQKTDAMGNSIVYTERVPTPEEREKAPWWEKALMGSAAVIGLGVAGYLLIRGVERRKE
jgi:hypothetical protein